jgi:hypothetical protein
MKWAKRITPDCNTAYAMSKKALQDNVMREIVERTVALDAVLPQLIKAIVERRTPVVARS